MNIAALKSDLAAVGSSVPAEVDVLIIGLGPAGAALANLLGRYGVRVLVVERHPDIFRAPRAIALDDEALRALQLAGLPEGSFETIAVPYARLHSTVVGEFARFNTSGAHDGHPRQVTFYQPELEERLREQLARHEGVSVTLSTEFLGFIEDATGLTAKLRLTGGREVTVRAGYLVGADGANSSVRQLIGAEFEGRTFGNDWLVVDAGKKDKVIDHIEFVCDPKRPCPHMAAPGGRERWEFRLNEGEPRAEWESDARLAELLRPWGTLADLAVERKAIYRFQARVASRFSKGRVFLVGDAAHLTPPFVGQGLVAALRDITNLSWKLAWVINGRAGAKILESYDLERRAHAKSIIDLARFMGMLVAPRNWLSALAIHGGLKLAMKIPALRRHIQDLGIKPKNQFAKGLFVAGKSGARLARGGVLPQGWVRNAVGEIVLSDEVVGDYLTLISFGPAPTLDPKTMRAFEALGGRVVELLPRGYRPNGSNPLQWEDLDGTFLPHAVPFGWVAIVRPDRVVAQDGPATEAEQLIRTVLALLQPDWETTAAPVPR